MAACSIGSSSLKLSSLNLGSVTPKSNASRLKMLHCPKALKFIQCEGLGLVSTQRTHKRLIQCQCSVSDIDAAAISEESTVKDKYSGLVSKLTPSSLEVESLLTTICDSSIAEVELKFGGFRLHVTRDVTEQTVPSPPPTSAPSSVTTPEETSASNGSVSSQSLAIIKPRVRTLSDIVADESLNILPSPRVGFFRRSRAIKGKRAPPSCKEKQQVKTGQVLCYIEQLGGEIPIESDVSGEVIKIFCQDGDPVGYGDPLIAILPSFPGIMQLQ